MKYVAIVDGVEVAVDVQPGAGPGLYTVTAGGHTHEVDLQRTARDWLYSLLLDGRSYQVARTAGEIQIETRWFSVEVERDLGVARDRPAGAAAGLAHLKALIPGLVVSVNVRPGDEVHEGQALIILEAMKMQMELKSPRAGHVTEVGVQPGQEVAQGQSLVVIGD